MLQISLAEAKLKFPRRKLEIGDVVNIEVTPKNFGRIAAQKAKQVVVQKIREEERKVLYNQYSREFLLLIDCPKQFHIHGFALASYKILFFLKRPPESW